VPVSASHKGLIQKISNQLKNALNSSNKHGLDFSSAKRKSVANYLPIDSTGATKQFEQSGMLSGTFRNNDLHNSA